MLTYSLLHMCIAAPGKIIKVDGKAATVEYPGTTRQVLIGNESVKIGDWVLVQMGIIIKILTPEESAASQKAWSEVS